MPGPLEGFRILDASEVVSGPLATQLLADQGAEVIKLERPAQGDTVRRMGFRRGGMSSLFVNVNRGKRSVAVDLAKPAGRELARALVSRADVFVQNWRPGAAERLGLGAAALCDAHPALVYVSVSGFGASGPYRDRRVYDPIIQGLSGHVAVQKNPDVPIPDLVRTLVVDKATAYTAAQSITAALLARERGAGGQHLEIAMLDAALAFFWPDGMMGHSWVDPVDFAGPTLAETYRLWETRDGHLLYWVGQDSEAHGLFRALGHEEWCTDARFESLRARTENRDALGALLQEAIAGWERDALLARLVANDVPCGPVLDLSEVFEDPQVQHNQSIAVAEVPGSGPLRLARPPTRFARTPQAPGRPAPRLGEHTREVLGELGIEAERVAALEREAVIRCAQ
jgi:crotonobetainyl-CoA:carnitine CoA-transferase CaiB-like acyl-CoA transferase